MASLGDLPVELMNAVCSNMSRADILSLRHTSRKVAAVSYDGFSQTFDSITVTCSKAGLDRLEALVADAGDHILSKITHVKVHILNAYRLEELAESLNSAPKKYRAAYVRLRKVLLAGLKACPNLKILTVTNECFGLVEDPKINPCDIRSHDFNLLLRPADRDYEGFRYRIYGFESVLSVFKIIHKQYHELHLCYTSVDLEVADYPDLFQDWIWPSGMLPPVRPNIQRIMFGADQCDIGPIIRRSLRRLTLRGAAKCTQLDSSPDCNFLLAARQSPLTHLSIGRSFSSDTTLEELFHAKSDWYPALENIRISGSEVDDGYGATLLHPDRPVKHIEIRDCRTCNRIWQNLLTTIVSSRHGRHVQIENCSLYPDSATSLDPIYTFSVVYDHARQAFVEKATGGDDSARETCFRTLFGAARVEYL